MPLLAASELAAIQSVAQEGMTGLATILTRATVVTADGQESVWATSGIDVKCWVYESTPGGATLGAIAGGVALSEVFSIRFPVGTAVDSGDRIAIGSTIYDVQHTNSDDTYPAWLECACRLVE